MRLLLQILFCLFITIDSLGHIDAWGLKLFAPAKNEVNQNGPFELNSFLKRINQLYNRSGRLDTLERYSEVKDAGGGYYFTGHKQVYQYEDFIFIQYPDSSAANKEFGKITQLVKGKMNGPQDWHLEAFNKSFSRTGIVLIQTNEWIITHPRNCQYDESREVPREDKLFAMIKASDKKFIRIRCEYKKIEMR